MSPESPVTRPKRSLCWIRRDLRLVDHAALAEATQLSKQVVVVFVFDTTILSALTDRADRRMTYIHTALREVDQKLRALGSRLLVLHGDPQQLIPQLAQELGVDSVFAARDYEPYACLRDKSVSGALDEAGIAFSLVKDQLIFEPNEISAGNGNPYRVFSPFRRAWEKLFVPERDAASAVFDTSRLWPLGSLPPEHEYRFPSLEQLGFVESDLWLQPGEDAARRRLEGFAPHISAYGEDRDFPALDGTSTISVDLRFGTISIREALRLTLDHPGSGADSWRGELIWREFYQHILFHNPEVECVPFQTHLRDIQYPGLDQDFQAWCDGQTGFPIVDAAMRCLNASGWMHNRLRMVVASFLTKDLLVDYRKGEAYFAAKLLDFDLASNNGGWQWSASTGADPQPYFRIFNPLLQSQKFDPTGSFIRKWVPELRELACPAVFAPVSASKFELLAAGVELGSTYPFPIVDHAVQKGKAIALLSGKKG